MRFRCWGIEATLAAAQALAQSIGAEGLVLGLIGPLGAGKTAFAKGLAGGLGVDPTTVSSPTFVIANEYAAHGRKLAHVDLHRLESAAQLDDIGFVDMLDPGAVVVVEWADRLPDALPADRLELRISRETEAGEAAGSDAQESRSFSASATRQGSQRVLEAWQELLRGLPGVEML